MMKQMNVAMYYNNHDVRIEKQPIPKISADELLIKIMASGICGSDVMEWYRIKKAPLVLGHEIAGIIEEIGDNVKGYHKGDRVFATHHVPCKTCRYCQNEQYTLCHTLHTTKFYPGGFAEYVRIPEININRGTFHLPDDMSFETATFIEPLACVVRGFRQVPINTSQSVTIIGSGVAGLLNLKLAKAIGASPLFATDIVPYRVNMAKQAGADYTISATDDVPKFIREHNNGRGSDIVILCAGSINAFKQALSSIEPGGTLLLFAPTKPKEIIPIDLFDIWNKQITIVSTYAGAEKDILDAIELLRSKDITVSDMISHRLPLQEAQKGFSLVADAKESMKVILYPHGATSD